MSVRVVTVGYIYVISVGVNSVAEEKIRVYREI